jgi:hypothetical protein
VTGVDFGVIVGDASRTVGESDSGSEEKADGDGGFIDKLTLIGDFVVVVLVVLRVLALGVGSDTVAFRGVIVLVRDAAVAVPTLPSPNVVVAVVVVVDIAGDERLGRLMSAVGINVAAIIGDFLG